MCEKYNGWTNYETWNVKLWMDNDEGTSNDWKERAQVAWDETNDKEPNQYMTHERNAVSCLVEELKADLDAQAEAFMASQNGPLADLLTGAMSSINWYEIAESLLEDVEKNKEVDA